MAAAAPFQGMYDDGRSAGEPEIDPVPAPRHHKHRRARG
jgi:hypothetical protein